MWTTNRIGKFNISRRNNNYANRIKFNILKLNMYPFFSPLVYLNVHIESSFFWTTSTTTVGVLPDTVTLQLNNIQLLPALKVNIIIVYLRGVVFPEGKRGKTTSQGWTIMKFMKTQDKNTQINVYCIQHYCK
jgi:hypothetical protein